MNIFNSLSRRVEEFGPLKRKRVGMYCCGPTVYDYAHIGNFRTYTLADLIYRVLKYEGYEVEYVMNLTDVGHLTGDNLGDADTGEDRMEVMAKKQHKSAWDVAKFYTEAFLADFDELNLVRPRLFCKATEHITEQIELVKRLSAKGYAYTIDDGVYFDTSKLADYGKLSTLAEIEEGARVEVNAQKKNARDFALWKFSVPEDKRQMEWDSPWGRGWPGWHIECSAMAMKYLGETFDIHAGGEDLRSTHHPNEIAQSEAATGKPFVKYWVHGAFVQIEGGRMSKSLGNNYRLADLKEKGFSAMALRYLYLTAHYRSPLNFTWSSLAGAQSAYDKLETFVQSSKLNVQSSMRKELSREKLRKLQKYRERFWQAVGEDLGFPQALAAMWEMLKSNISDYDKLDLLWDWDSVLGLSLGGAAQEKIPEEVNKVIRERESLRLAGRFVEADSLRMRLAKMGYTIKDTAHGAVVTKK